MPDVKKMLIKKKTPDGDFYISRRYKSIFMGQTWL